MIGSRIYEYNEDRDGNWDDRAVEAGSRDGDSCNKQQKLREIPVTALMTLTAGVKRPSAMTQLAPNKHHKSNAILTILFSLIQEPLTRRPERSVVESIVSVVVSINKSSELMLGECLSRRRYRLRIIYRTNVPPIIMRNGEEIVIPSP